MQLFSPCWRSWLLCFQVLSFLCSFLFFYLVCHKRGQLQNIYDERVIKHGSFVRAGVQLRSTSKGQSWRNAFKKEWPLVVRGNHHSRNAVRSNPLFWHWLKVNQRLQFSNKVRGWQRTAWKRLLVNKRRHVEKFWDKLMKFKKNHYSFKTMLFLCTSSFRKYFHPILSMWNSGRFIFTPGPYMLLFFVYGLVFSTKSN